MTEAVLVKTHRVLVALDTSARGRAALEAAVRLAQNLHAELQGLFVEDEDLVRLASLPFAREVDLASASSRELGSINMERALRAAAEEAQRTFVAASEQVNLRWTFRVVRGTVAQASLAAAVDVDLLVIGQQGRSPRIMASDALRYRFGNKRRVVAVFGGSPSDLRALKFASRLAEPRNVVLTVVVIADNGEEAISQCTSWLQQHHVRAEVEQVRTPSEDAVVDFARKWRPAVLVLNRDSEFVTDSRICRLVNEFDCPLILC